MTYPSYASELSAHQKQILALYMQDVPAKEIGEQLGITAKTVNNTLDQCQWKLRLHSREELRVYAHFYGLDKVEVSA